MEGLKSCTLSFAWNSTTLSSQIWYPVFFFNFTDKISRPSFIGKEGSIYFLRFAEKIGYQMLSVICNKAICILWNLNRGKWKYDRNMITHMNFFTTLVTMLRSVRLYQTRARFKSRRVKINGLEPGLQKNVKSVDSLKVQPHSSGIGQSA